MKTHLDQVSFTKPFHWKTDGILWVNSEILCLEFINFNLQSADILTQLFEKWPWNHWAPFTCRCFPQVASYTPDHCCQVSLLKAFSCFLWFRLKKLVVAGCIFFWLILLTVSIVCQSSVGLCVLLVLCCHCTSQMCSITQAIKTQQKGYYVGQYSCLYALSILITLVKEVMFSLASIHQSVCLSGNNCTQKLLHGFGWNFQEMLGGTQGTIDNWHFVIWIMVCYPQLCDFSFSQHLATLL